jgi:6,7-dimethyl-8-ribityllumazine synthase
MVEYSPHILIIDARFYADIADELVAGAHQALDRAQAKITRISVPGVLEIPSALAMARAAVAAGKADFDGYVLLGCVIRGETSHYDIVANESARSIMDQGVAGNDATGNGILTVDSRDQALIRAGRSGKKTVRTAAKAALDLIAIKRRLDLP